MYISKDDPNRNYFLHHCQNIVKTEDGYVLQPVYYEVNDNHIEETDENKTNPTQNERIKNCSLCIHNSGDNCVIRTRLEKLSPNHVIPCWWNNKCDAYEPLQELTVINSIEEMINFIEKSENFFGSPEEYEEYQVDSWLLPPVIPLSCNVTYPSLSVFRSYFRFCIPPDPL